jgi:hypothetical protein
MMKKLGLLFSMVMVVIAMVGSANADFIKPTSITVSSEYSGNLGVRAIDGSGLSEESPAGTHANGNSDAWFINNEVVDGSYAIFDLGETLNVYQAYVWNENQATSSLYTQRGVATMNILISPDSDPATATWTDLGLVTVARAGGTSTEPAQVFSIAANGTRLIKFVLRTAQSGKTNEYCGLGEVRFEAYDVTANTPNPANGESDVELDLSAQAVSGAVSWLAPDDPSVTADGYNVYMDVDLSAVEAATATAPGTMYSSPGQPGTNFDPGEDLYYGATYYWRVDTIVDSEVVTGDVLSFKTVKDPAIIPSETLLFEDLAGSGASPLNGTMPDVGDAAWIASASYTDDGGTAGQNQSACLPFVPVAGKRYVLSGTMDASYGSSWLSVGFTNGLTGTGNLSQTSTYGTGWFLQTASGGGTFFMGPRTASNSDYTSGPGITNFRTVLDTRPENWTVECSLAPAGDPLYTIRGPEAWASNPAIKGIMYGTYGNGLGDFDRISLIESELYNAWSPEGVVPSGDVTLSWEFGDKAPVVDVLYTDDPYSGTWTPLLVAEPNTTTSVTISDLPINETYYWRIDAYFDGPDADPNLGATWSFTTFDASFAVDAGADMATWSGQPVVMNPVLEGAGAPSVTWTADAVSLADPNLVIEITNADQADASVVITNLDPTAEPVKTVTMTLDAATQYTGDVDTMTIDVYENPCAAAYGLDLIGPANIAGDDCVTNLVDLALMASYWLEDTTPLAPVAIP